MVVGVGYSILNQRGLICRNFAHGNTGIFVGAVLWLAGQIVGGMSG